MLLFVLPAAGFATELRPERLTGVADPEARLEDLALDLRARFEERLERYAGELARTPYDVPAHVDRCRFIELVSYDYEYLAWVDEVRERHTHCLEELLQQFPGHPEVELYRLEQLYGAERLEAGAELVALLGRRGFTTGQTARLYAMLATTAEAQGHESAGDYAIRALELDRSADVKLVAAGHLVRSGQKDRAIEVLTSPFDARGAHDGWYTARKMQMLAELGAYEEVGKLYASLRQGDGEYNHFEAASALAMTGALETARAEFELAEHWSTEDERARFRFEMEHGSASEALTAYQALRDQGWKEDPVAINRIALFMRDPLLGWQARDFLGLAALAGSAAVIALAALLPLFLVHYRGLARRARRGGQVAVADGWQLRHAWVALFAFGLASLLSLYTAGPLSFAADPAALGGIDAADTQLATIAVSQTFLAILLLLPLLKLAGVRQPAAWAVRWSIAKSVLAGLIGAVLLRIPLFVMLGVDPESVTSLAAQDSVWQPLALVGAEYGIAAAFWIVALAAPAVEEFVFRGVLLRALAGHIGFGWANALQAALFAAAHLDASVAPMVFVLGLCAGWLAQRSGGLLAPMALHAVFNLVAALVVL